MVDLKQSVQFIKGVGPSRVKLLNYLGIYTLEDLITYYPRRYEDRRIVKSIDSMEDGEEGLIKVVAISNVSTVRLRKNMTLSRLTVRDKSGICLITWFNQPYVKDRIRVGETYKFYGKVTIKNGRVEMNSPVFDSE